MRSIFKICGNEKTKSWPLGKLFSPINVNAKVDSAGRVTLFLRGNFSHLNGAFVKDFKFICSLLT